jgi:hypothetical protein
MSFNDGGTLWQTSRLAWGASTNLTGADVALEYSTNQWATADLIATVPATNEFYLWAPTFSHPAVQWRVRDPASGFASTNAKVFTIRATTNAAFSFYVNDASTNHDVYCSATGSVSNTGISSNSPMADLQVLLATFDLEGGDTVYVDTGIIFSRRRFQLPIRFGRRGAPVRLIGSPRGTTLNRGSTLADVLDLTGASHLEIERLRLEGGRYGLNGGTDGILLRNIHAVGNQYGYYVTGSGHLFERCLAANNTCVRVLRDSTQSRSNQVE